MDCVKSYCEDQDYDLEDITEDMLPNIHTCAICGAVHDASDMEQATDGRFVCQECMDDGRVCDSYERCEHCGDLVPSDDVELVHTSRSYTGNTTDEYWCSDCIDNDATTCDDCGEIWSDDLISSYDVTDEYGDTVTRTLCESCIEDHYYTCEECGNLVHADNAQVDDWGDARCPNCRKSDKLKAYGKTYASEFFDTGDGDLFAHSLGLYLGIELETEATRDEDPGSLAEDLCYEIGEDKIECKEDGSLDYGCEIVTQPMSPAYHLGSESIWPDVVRVCRNHGATSHDNGDCGMHIHISRAALSSDGYYSPSYALDRIVRTHRAEWVKFARRSCGMRWCAIDEATPDTTTPVYEKYRHWMREDHSDRYRAVNFVPTQTVEIRLMRGSLNLETIRASIEMVTGLVLVCHHYANDNIDPDTKSWDDITADVMAALTAWDMPTDDLTSYLQRRGLAPATVTA